MIVEIKTRFPKLSRCIPPILGIIVPVVSIGVAIAFTDPPEPYSDEEDSDTWPTIKIHPDAMRNVKNGATLQYREYAVSPSHHVSQMTTQPTWSEELDAEYNQKTSVPKF